MYISEGQVLADSEEQDQIPDLHILTARSVSTLCLHCSPLCLQPIGGLGQNLECLQPIEGIDLPWTKSKVIPTNKSCFMRKPVFRASDPV